MHNPTPAHDWKQRKPKSLAADSEQSVSALDTRRVNRNGSEQRTTPLKITNIRGRTWRVREPDFDLLRSLHFLSVTTALGTQRTQDNLSFDSCHHGLVRMDFKLHLTVSEVH